MSSDSSPLLAHQPGSDQEIVLSVGSSIQIVVSPRKIVFRSNAELLMNNCYFLFSGMDN